MRSVLTRVIFLTILVATLASPAAQAQLGATVPNWTVPSSSSGSGSHSGGIRTLGDVTSPLPFVGVTPCRIVDTRGAVGTFGGPALAGGTPRSFPLPTGPCTGLPAAPRAYSLNITAVDAKGPGFLLLFPQGGIQPVVSTLNYLAGQTVANAAIVPAGVGGGVTVIAGVSGTGLLIDIDGYYSDTLGNPSNFFVLNNNSGGFTMELTNQATTCALTCGLAVTVLSGRAIRGDGAEDGGILGTTGSTTANAFGVTGSSLAATGITYGVRGTNATADNDTAGVFGTDAIVTSFVPGSQIVGSAGVRGEGKNGVIGVASSNNKEIGSVVGLMLDGTGGLTSFGILGYSTTVAVQAFGSIVTTSAKDFVEPHATDPGKMIAYVSLEGPESGTYFRGTARIVNGTAVIRVPDHFAMVTDSDGLTVQLTPVGAAASMYVVSENLDQILVRSNRDVTFHYLVNGIRHSLKDHQVFAENDVFVPRSGDGTMPAVFLEAQKQRLIDNGTYNPDGTVNMVTAERMGWAKAWADREAANRAAAEAASKKFTKE